MDDTRYINHSDSPNLRFDMESRTIVALRDIDEFEELTLNYTEFDKSVGQQ
jgi:SET domain-containing protein